MQKTQVDVDSMYAEEEHISQVHFKQDNSKQRILGKDKKNHLLGQQT